MSSRYLAVMVLLVDGTSMNLPFMMIEHIKSAAGRSKEKTCLPYDMVFILLFTDAGIDSNGEDSKSFTYTDYYTIQSLHRMKFGKKNSVWIREIEGVYPHVSGSSSSTSDSARPSSPAPVVAPSSSVPTPTLDSVAGEHHPISPHTPAIFYSFSANSIVEQVMEHIFKKIDDMFSNIKLQITRSLEE
ncbi:putative Patatin [Cocos nucifera]|uniref:Putative Patatin n=1 Tax=Cocos nucifera TaxID=13894 RepID=A0A8K0MYR9_COCNU|nr:putative Patatin [Cocos nucifera]